MIQKYGHKAITRIYIKWNRYKIFTTSFATISFKNIRIIILNNTISKNNFKHMLNNISVYF